MPPTPPLDRRSLLRRGLQVGAVVAGAVAAAAVVETSVGHAPATTTTTTRPAPNPANAVDWVRLRRSLTGRLVRPGNPSYPNDRLLYNAKFMDQHPQGIALCASSDDVARCIDFARSHDLQLCARSGGHSYGGYSSCDGLVIDVTPMSQVRVDASRNVATIGAGARLIDVYNTVGAEGRLIPGGSCPTVGIAGLALGGGVGVFGRKYGLTTDNLTSVNLVTADGRHLRASRGDHDDLHWASQGGGGGNFGVATSFEFAVHPMPPVTLYTLQFPWPAAGETLVGWQRWVASAPDEMWSDCQLLSQGTAGLLVEVNGVYCGAPAHVAGLLDQLVHHVGSAPTYRFQGTDAYMHAMMNEAGCSGLSVASCHLDTQFRGGTRSHEAYSAKSSFVSSPMNAARAEQMVQAIEHLSSVAPYVGGALAFDAYGGVINRTAEDATAFVHRDKVAGIQATYSWSSFTSSSQVEAGRQWLAWLGTNVFAAVDGAYQNYIDPTLSDWATAYYGANLARLSRVKRKYDPDNVFRFAQSVPLQNK